MCILTFFVFLARPAWHAIADRLHLLLMLLTVLMAPLETNYLRKYWTYLHQIFRIGTHMWA